MLTSRCLGKVQVGYPLKLIVKDTKKVDVDFNPEFIQRMLPRIDWQALRDAASTVGVDLPPKAPSVPDAGDPAMELAAAAAANASSSSSNVESPMSGVQSTSSDTSNEPPSLNEETLKQIHHALLEVDIIEGELICPETGRKFPITEGVPNMLVNEDEV